MVGIEVKILIYLLIYLYYYCRKRKQLRDHLYIPSCVWTLCFRRLMVVAQVAGTELMQLC